MTHQGFAGSISTSALLIGAALAILLAVGAVVAFEGFPGPSGEGATETLVLESPVDAAARPAPQLILDASRGTEPDGSDTPSGSATAAADFFSPSAPAAPSMVPIGPLGSAGAPAAFLDGGDPTDQSGPPPPSVSDGGDPVGGTVDQFAGGVKDTSDTLDRAVDEVLPEDEFDGALPDGEPEGSPEAAAPSDDGLVGVVSPLYGSGQLGG